MKSTRLSNISLVSPVLVPDKSARMTYSPQLVPVKFFYLDLVDAYAPDNDLVDAYAPDNDLVDAYEAKEINFIPKSEADNNYSVNHLTKDTIQVILSNHYELAIPVTNIASVLYKEK